MTIRVLQILGTIPIGGVGAVLKNWHKNIDRQKIQFDYLMCDNGIKNDFIDIVSKLGGKVFLLPSPNMLNFITYIKQIIEIFKNNHYDIIHSHTTQLNFFYYPIAKTYGIKNIIQHSHNTKWSDKFLNGLRNRFLFFWVRHFITKKLACSDLAGQFLFKKDYEVINNSIDTEKFKFNQEIRNKIRKELNIENKFVISNIGRFDKQKNYPFLINVFNEIYKKNKNSILLLIGDGALRKQIENQVQDLNLKNNVIFTGTKKNVSDYYQAMDVFILPSLFEGFGIVAIEAQCSGLPCFISNGVPKEVMICNTTRISLNKSSKEWADVILEETKNFNRKDNCNLIKDSGFDIKDTAKKIQNIYLQLSGKNND